MTPAVACDDPSSLLEDVRWARGLRRCREALGFTQERFAVLAGFVSKTQVCELERGRRQFSRRTLLQIGKALSLTETADVIRCLDGWASDDDDGDLIDEDPPVVTADSYEAALRDLADETLTWKSLAMRRGRRLDEVSEQLAVGDLAGASKAIAFWRDGEVHRG